MPTFTTQKDPDAELPYSFDWSEWLAERGSEVIDTVVWVISGDDSALVKLSEGGDSQRRTIYLGGGTAGVTYTVSCQITTAGSPSMTDERRLAVEVLER